MKILMATAEFAPLATTGALGNQVRRLAVELRKLGHDVSVVLPCYRTARESAHDLHNTGVEFQLNLGGKRVSADVLETKSSDQIQTFLVRRDEYFDRSGIYSGDGSRPYEDNAERFIFFSKAVIELGRRLSPSPDILHGHEWTTALVPVFVRERQLPFKTILTIHDLQHQGSFWSFDFALTNLPGHYFGPRAVEFYGRLNFLKAGILYSDSVTMPGDPAMHTGFTSEGGFGLDAVLLENAGHIRGIPFGLDYETVTPAFSELLGQAPSAPAAATAKKTKAPAGAKKDCRAELLRQLELAPLPDGRPIIVLPIQSGDEKALVPVLPIVDLLLTSERRLVVTGEIPRTQVAPLFVAERKYPGRLAVVAAGNEKSQLLALAGADLSLFPSRLGPSCVNLLASLRYGTIPIIRFRGGLRQVATDFDPVRGTGSSLVYYLDTPEAVWDAIQRGSWLLGHPDFWEQATAAATTVDFSWAESAKAFGDLYANLLRHQQAASA